MGRYAPNLDDQEPIQNLHFSALSHIFVTGLFATHPGMLLGVTKVLSTLIILPERLRYRNYLLLFSRCWVLYVLQAQIPKEMESLRPIRSPSNYRRMRLSCLFGRFPPHLQPTVGFEPTTTGLQNQRIKNITFLITNHLKKIQNLTWRPAWR